MVSCNCLAMSAFLRLTINDVAKVLEDEGNRMMMTLHSSFVEWHKALLVGCMK